MRKFLIQLYTFYKANKHYHSESSKATFHDVFFNLISDQCYSHGPAISTTYRAQSSS